jgi:branched-chain amino acid transport system substrate-binding protein
MLFAAIERVAAKRPDGTLHIGRHALRAALYATKDFAGVTGILTCDEFGDCGYPVFNVLRLDDPAQGAAALQKNVQFTYSPGK